MTEEAKAGFAAGIVATLLVGAHIYAVYTTGMIIWAAVNGAGVPCSCC